MKKRNKTRVKAMLEKYRAKDKMMSAAGGMSDIQPESYLMDAIPRKIGEYGTAVANAFKPATPAAPNPAPAGAAANPISDYAGLGAAKRREAAVGLNTGTSRIKKKKMGGLRGC